MCVCVCVGGGGGGCEALSGRPPFQGFAMRGDPEVSMVAGRTPFLFHFPLSSTF